MLFKKCFIVNHLLNDPPYLIPCNTPLIGNDNNESSGWGGALGGRSVGEESLGGVGHATGRRLGKGLPLCVVPVAFTATLLAGLAGVTASRIPQQRWGNRCAAWEVGGRNGAGWVLTWEGKEDPKAAWPLELCSVANCEPNAAPWVRCWWFL